MIASLFLASFPALIFLSSQISNDGLFTLFGFLWYGSLLVALEKQSRASTIMVGLLCGLGLLTKTNAVAWLIISVVLLYMSTFPLAQRLRSIGVVTIVSALTGGWWYVLRVFSTTSFSPVANAFDQASTVLLSPSLREIFTFNPLAMILHPAPSAMESATRSANFLETLFRTSQVGSLFFSPDVAILLVVALMLLIVILLGVLHECRRGAPIHSLAVLLFILSVLFFRLQYPFSTSQHFRYITPVVIPLTFLLVHGITSIRTRFAKILAEAVLGVYALLVTMIVMSVVYFS